MKTTKTLIMFCAVAMVCLTAVATPAWQAQVEQLMRQGEFKQATRLMDRLPKAERKAQAVVIDSLKTIMRRIERDFSMTPEEGERLIGERVPNVTPEQLARWKAARQLEVMHIDGHERWFRKSVRNLWLLAPEFKQSQDADRKASYEEKRQQFVETMKAEAGPNFTRDWRQADITFSLDVEADAVPAGETLRVWMPIPYRNARQRNIEITWGNRAYHESEGSKHHTIYMEAVAKKGEPTHFEYRFNFEIAERHLAQQDILTMLEPYDTNNPEYKEFTGNQAPHIIITDEMRALARRIVGNETNPVLQAQLVFDWISKTFPWAGAREYSTLENIPQYVLDNNHGDCGQVTLLYITLVRSLGIPARWESGWWIKPGEENWHDWAETYFEGVGWVYTDQSNGRSTYGTPMSTYYATGMDLYRMASNEATGDELEPKKTFIRSETVDFQPGEVEWRGGNLFYDKWSSHLKVNSLIPINEVQDQKIKKLIK